MSTTRLETEYEDQVPDNKIIVVTEHALYFIKASRRHPLKLTSSVVTRVRLVTLVVSVARVTGLTLITWPPPGT